MPQRAGVARLALQEKFFLLLIPWNSRDSARQNFFAGVLVTHATGVGHSFMSTGPSRDFEARALDCIAEGQRLWEGRQQRAGEEHFLAALEILLRHYRHEMVGFCVEMLQWSGLDAEGVAHGIFIAAYQGMPGFKPQGSLRTWLYQIARHLCAHTLRDETRHRASVERHRATIEDRVHRRPEGPADARLHRQEWLERVRVGLRQLNECDRTVLVMTYMRELPTDQIAKILMITPQDVRTRRSRALRRLREVIDDDAE
jgi:RNA polymerase sigma-70 factor (ECF subfamily)